MKINAAFMKTNRLFMIFSDIIFAFSFFRRCSESKHKFLFLRSRPPSISENTSVHRGLGEGGLFSIPPSDLPLTSLRTSFTQKSRTETQSFSSFFFTTDSWTSQAAAWLVQESVVVCIIWGRCKVRCEGGVREVSKQDLPMQSACVYRHFKRLRDVLT